MALPYAMLPPGQRKSHLEAIALARRQETPPANHRVGDVVPISKYLASLVDLPSGQVDMSVYSDAIRTLMEERKVVHQEGYFVTCGRVLVEDNHILFRDTRAGTTFYDRVGEIAPRLVAMREEFSADSHALLYCIADASSPILQAVELLTSPSMHLVHASGRLSYTPKRVP